jgi:uncharacterized protein YndB with AHSA1/START domain
MPNWELTIDVDAPPERTWAFIGDPTTVPRWYPKYVRCEIEGDVRVLTSAEGAVLRETMFDRDEEGLSYSYSVISGAPVASHRASFEVRAREGGSTVIWRTEAEPSDPSVDLEARLLPTQTDALTRIKQIVEEQTTG